MRDNDGDIDIPVLVSTLAGHKWAIALGTLAFLALGTAYLVLATPQYEANAVVQVEGRPPSVPGLQAETAATVPSPAEAPTATESQLLTSRRVLSEAMVNLRLDVAARPQRFPLVGGLAAQLHERLHPGVLAAPWFGLDRYGWGGERIEIARLTVPPELYDVPLQLVAGEHGRYALLGPTGDVLVRSRVGRLGLSRNGVSLQLKTLRANPGMRFEVVRMNPMAVMSGLKSDITVSEQGRNSGVIALTYANLDPVRAKQVLEQVTRTYVRQNIARNSEEAAKRLEFVDEQLPNVRRELDEAQAALRDFQARTQTLDVEVQNQSLLTQSVALDANIQQLQMQLAELAGRYTPAHPAYATLQSQIRRFQGQKAALEGRIGQLPDTQQGRYRLVRDVEVTNQTYANLLDQAQQLNIARASAVGNVRIIDPADVNLVRPAWPKPLPVLAGAAALGAMFMVSFVLLRQMFKRGVEDPIDIELLGLPVYASIPFSAKGRQIAARPGRLRRDGRQRLLALRSPSDLAMEALRTLRTSLHFANLEMKNNMLMIAAPSPGVGKTFVCANLAVTIAQAGQRVLLIDADMRRGTLHRAVGVRSEGGLSELISGQIDVEDALRLVPGADNLSFISRGAVPPNPSELLMHPRFAEMLEQMRRRYDIIVVDTPPVLAVTDATVIGQYVGSCLMVVRWGLNQQREIALAKQRLEQNGVNVRGAIFNAVEKRGAGQYTYSYYGYRPPGSPSAAR